MADWYTKIAEQIVGPLSPDQLKALAEGGRLTPNDPIARSKDGPWVPASRVKGLFEAAAIDDEPPAPPQPTEAALPTTQRANEAPPAAPFERPPIPQPPVLMPKRTEAQLVPPVVTVESPPETSLEPGPLGGFAIQAEDVAAAGRRHKKKRVKGAKEPLTEKQKNARLVKWLALAVVAGIVVFASIPFVRRVTRTAPATGPAKKPVAADVRVDTSGKGLEETFGKVSQTGPARAAAPTSRAAQGTDDHGQTGPADGTAAVSESTGGVEVKPIRVALDRPQMTSADGRTARPAKPCLLVEFELRTTAPDASVRFRGWLSSADEISLADDRGTEYKVRTPKNFQGMFVDGQCRETTFLSAEKPTTDVVVFSWPDGAPELPSTSEEVLKLRLPKSVYGEEGEMRIEIPLTEIDVLQTPVSKPAEETSTSDNVEKGDERIPIPGLMNKR